MALRDKDFSKLTKLQQIRIRESEGYQDEDLMLSDFMTHMNNQLINTNPDLCKTVFHIENEGNFGGKFGAISGAISKGKGKKKGVLDVESVYINVNWLEFKRKDGICSDEQLDFIGLVVGWGQPVFMIRDGYDAFDFFWFIIIEIIAKGVKVKGDVYTNIEQVKRAI